GRPRIDDPGTAGDVHRPLLGPLLDVGPAELAGPGRVELVAQRRGVVVVEEAEGLAGGERVEPLEDRLVPHPRRHGPHVQRLCHGSLLLALVAEATRWLLF